MSVASGSVKTKEEGSQRLFVGPRGSGQMRTGESAVAVIRGTRMAVVLALVATVAVNAALAWQAGAAIRGLQNREFELVRSARLLEGEAPSLLSSVRGYLITQDPGFIDEFVEGRQLARTTVASLRGRVLTAEGRELLNTVDAQIERLISGSEQRINLARTGRLSEALLESEDTRRAEREVFASLDQLVEAEEALLGRRLNDLQNERLAGLGFSALLLGGVGILAAGILGRSQHELQAALQQRDEFLGSISHDLKNPLTTIKARAQLLQKRLQRRGSNEDDSLIEGLASIDQTTTRVATMLDELVDLARLQVGRPLAIDRQPTDLVALARQVTADQQQATERHRLVVETDAPTLVGVWDAIRLERVIGNLLSNAVKYSPAGGEITIVVTRAEGTSGPLAVLAVEDRGVGVPAEDLPHVFDRFHRGSNVTGRISGSGLGLTGVRHIVEAHGGSVSVSSQEGSGSAFTIRLPL